MPRRPAWADRTGRRTARGTATLLSLATLLLPIAVSAQVPELTARDRVRVCADPANLPFSNRAREGFENKIADIVADELKLPLHYYWVPQGPGFARNTLGTGICDLIVGYATGSGVVQSTNPYYASSYVFITKRGGPLDGVDTFEDAHLKGRKLGVIAATPPADHLLRLGLTQEAKTYALLVDRRYSSPAEEALADLVTGTIDGAILWGPIGGYFASRATEPLSVLPLHTSERPGLTYRIAFGIRPNEPEWKHRLNAVIRKRKADILAVLEHYGVPILPIEAGPAETAGPPTQDAGELQ